MARYADITPFYEWLEWMEKQCSSYPQYQTLMFYEIRNKLDDLPEVVLCKNCRYSDTFKCGRWCDRQERYVEDDDFCSEGEMKANG